MSRPDGFALAALALAVVVLFGPALFGDSAVFTWNMDLWHPWADDPGADPERPSRLADCARQFYVMRHLAAEAQQEGRIPLWNRWIFCGTPFLANFQPGVFYPPNLALAASPLSVPDQMSVYLAFHLFLAAAGVYVLLRGYGVSPAAALLGGVVFGASGFHAARTGIPTMVATGAWLPWALAASRRWFRSGDGLGFAGMAGSLAMAGLAGFAQIFVFTGYAWGIWGLVEGLRRPRRGALRRWTGWAAAGALGAGLVSIHLVPTLEFMALGQDARNTPAMLASGTLHPWALGKLVVPDLLGNPVDGTNATHLLQVGTGYYRQTERSTAVYLGLLPLLLAVPMLLAPGDRRRPTGAGLALAALGLALCLPGPVGAVLAKLPALDFSRPDRATFLLCFGVAVLAGLGADRLAGREGPGPGRTANGAALLVGALVVAFAGIVLLAGPRLLPQDVEAMAGPSIPRSALLALGIGIAAVVLVGARIAGRIPGRVFAIGALLLVGADLGHFAARLNVMQPEARIFPAPTPGGALEHLVAAREADGPFRVFRWEPLRSQFAGALPPATGAPYGIEDALGFDSLNLARVRDLMDAIDPGIVARRGNFRGVRDARNLDSPLLDLLGVRFVLATPEDGAGPGPWPSGDPADRPGLAMWERGTGQRVFLPGRVEIRADPEDVVARLAEPGFRPDLVALSEVPIPGLGPTPGDPALGDPAGDGAGGAGPAGTAHLEAHEDERVVVRIEPERPGLLVLADAWYPGWKASVDGVERPIHRVDHAFRGVVVGPGDREVVFTYAPASFRVGVGATLVALFAIVVLTLILHRTRSARSPEVA